MLGCLTKTDTNWIGNDDKGVIEVVVHSEFIKVDVNKLKNSIVCVDELHSFLKTKNTPRGFFNHPRAVVALSASLGGTNGRAAIAKEIRAIGAKLHMPEWKQFKARYGTIKWTVKYAKAPQVEKPKPSDLKEKAYEMAYEMCSQYVQASQKVLLILRHQSDIGRDKSRFDKAWPNRWM